MVLFIVLYKVVLTFESVDEILKCDHSNESYWTVLSCAGFRLLCCIRWFCLCLSCFCRKSPKAWRFKWKLLSCSTFRGAVFYFYCTEWLYLLSLWMKSPCTCAHSNESYWAVLLLTLFSTLHEVVLTLESVDVTIEISLFSSVVYSFPLSFVFLV